jgi:hypothetical protein
LSDAGRVEHERVRKETDVVGREPLEKFEGLEGLGFGAVIQPIFRLQAERIPRPPRACPPRNWLMGAQCSQSLPSVETLGDELGDDA